MNNYNTKYQMDQKVRIITGLFKGRVGKITGYSCDLTVGLAEDNANRSVKEFGFYTVKLSWAKDVYCQENQLESI